MLKEDIHILLIQREVIKQDIQLHIHLRTKRKEDIHILLMQREIIKQDIHILLLIHILLINKRQLLQGRKRRILILRLAHSNNRIISQLLYKLMFSLKGLVVEVHIRLNCLAEDQPKLKVVYKEEHKFLPQCRHRQQFTLILRILFPLVI